MKKTAILAALLLIGGAFLRRRDRKQARLDTRQFVSGLDLEAGLKLEVARLELVATASGQSPKTAFGVDWGTTKAVVSIPARAHYALDLSAQRPVDFRLEGRSLTAVFPEPRVSAVELDPREKRVVISSGWGRLAALSGASLEDSLERGLKDTAWLAASRPQRLTEVERAARPLLEKLVLDYAKPRGIAKVRVLFKSELSGEQGVGRLQDLEKALGALDAQQLAAQSLVGDQRGDAPEDF